MGAWCVCIEYLKVIAHPIPGDEHHFLAAHSSGNMYLYHDELPCPPGPVQYQLFKHGDGYTIHTCKTKSSRNPVYKWTIGSGAVHEFAFSNTQEAKFLAVVSQVRFFDFIAQIPILLRCFGPRQVVFREGDE